MLFHTAGLPKPPSNQLSGSKWQGSTPEDLTDGRGVSNRVELITMRNRLYRLLNHALDSEKDPSNMQLLLGGLASTLEDSVMFENSMSQLTESGKKSTASLGDPGGDVISNEDIEVSLQQECITGSQDSRAGFVLVMEDSEEDEDSSRRAGHSGKEGLDGPPHSDKENSLKRSSEEGSTTQVIDERHSSAKTWGCARTIFIRNSVELEETDQGKKYYCIR